MEPHRVTHSLVKALRAVPDFADLDDATLLRIVGASTNLFYPAGSVVFEPGSPAEALYVVLSGRFGSSTRRTARRSRCPGFEAATPSASSRCSWARSIRRPPRRRPRELPELAQGQGCGSVVIGEDDRTECMFDSPFSRESLGSASMGRVLGGRG